MVERTDWCGCRTRFDPPPPVVEGVEYVEVPFVVRGFDGCGRHADWIEALAESQAYNCGIKRLSDAGVAGVSYGHDGERLVFTAPDVPLGLAAILNATEPLQDWRHPCVPDEHQERFNALVVGHLLACRLQSR